MLYDGVFMLFLHTHTHTHTHTHRVKKLVTNQETAKSSSTDASTNYP